MNTEWLRVRVARKSVEAVAVCSYELVDARGGDLPVFSAGAHIDVRLPGGLTRPYSLCNPPTERRRYLIAALRSPDSRGGSAALHERVHAGDMLEISAPRNRFALAADASRSLLLAGGIGITPLLCMAEHLHLRRAAFQLHYLGRSRKRMAFVERLRSAEFAPQVHLHFDDAPASRRLDIAALLARPSSGTHLYVCGPQGFMDLVLETACRQGWPARQLHREFFSTQATDPLDTAQDSDFEVELARSGQVVPVAAGQSVVQALARVGIDVPVSCGEGLCGSCLTRVLHGEPDHRDLFLSPDERAANDQFTPCCSRALSARLVLDL